MRFLRVVCYSLTIALASSGYAGEIKCATVNMDKLLSKYHIAKKELSILQVEKYQYEEDNQKLIQEINRTESQLKSLISKLRQKDLSESERDEFLRKYDNLTEQYQALNKALQGSHQDLLREINTKRAKAKNQSMEKISTAVNKYAKAQKYQWVIDTSGHSSTRISPLVFARDATDITDEILAVLNKDAPKEKSN